MVVRLSPFPEELDRGYHGRLMRFNGYSDEGDFIRYAAKSCKLPMSLPREAVPIVVLSTLAGKTTEEFVRFHTLLPFRRAITNIRPEVAFGSLSSPSMLRTGTTRARQKHIFFCSECALEDVEFHGVSYWRRDHQITGQVWCPKHRVALSFVTKQSDVLKSPYSFRTQAVRVDKNLVDEAMRNDAVNRFLDIASGLAHRKKSLPGVAAAIEIRREAEMRGLFTYGKKDLRGVMSEFIRSSYPANWLARIMPELVDKAPETTLAPIDSVLNLIKRRWPSTSYLLIAAAIYKLSDEATTKLMNCEYKFSDKPLPIPIDKLIEEYAQAYGRYPSIAQSLKMSHADTARILGKARLPNLSQRRPTKNLFAAAYSLCFEGLTLADCSKQINASAKELSTWDIRPNSPLMRALRLMYPESAQKECLSEAVI